MVRNHYRTLIGPATSALQTSAQREICLNELDAFPRKQVGAVSSRVRRAVSRNFLARRGR